MSLRTIEFTVSADGSVTPVTEQKAGIQGEHNKTELVISVFSFENLTTSIFLKDVIRIQFIDGAGGFYSTEILNKDEEGNVRCTIPDEVTNAGGLVCAYVVLTQLYDTGRGPVMVKNVSISKPCKLRFEHSGVGSPSEYAYRVNISGALVNAEKFAGRAEEASEAAEETKLKVETAEADAYESAKQANKNATDADKSAKSAAASAEAAKSAQEAAEKEKTKAENAAIKAEEAAEKAIAFAKGNLLVFDTKEHLNQFIGGYESTKNLCPLPRGESTDYYSLTHNDNGTFNLDVSYEIGIPYYFGRVTLEPGVYVFTRYNCKFFIGITYYQMIPISKPFEVTETTEYKLWSSGYVGDSFKNAWVQITKGESVPDEFIPYYAPYTREDGKTVNDLSPGDILLITEEGVSDYWWDGNAIRPIEAQADQTFNPGSENPQSGVAVKEAVAAEQKRIDNISANAIKGTVSGSEILLTDVSPIVHDMKVRVSSDSISDLSTVKLIKSNGSGETIAEYTPTADGTVDSVTSRGAKQKNKSDIWDGSVSTGLQGTGSKDDPFLINSAADFAYFATSSHAKQYTKLMSDIYLNDVSDPEWYKGENLNTWTPGEAPGNFDGNGYVVHGIYINEPDNAKGAGLFGNIANEASQTISNLGIEDSYISVSTSSGYAAALFCMANWGAGPVVKNCYVSDTVILKGYSVGGLAGFLGITTTFINCYASAQITANHLDGALVAFGSYSDVYNQCYSSQNLSFVRYGGDNSTFTNCYAVDNTYCYKVTQLTTEQMTGEAAYDNMAGLDFRAVWYVNEYGLPRLRAFLYDAIELTTDTEGVKIYCEYNRNANKCLENISNKIASLRNYADSTFATITAFNTLKSIVARKKVTYRDVAQNEKLIIEKSKVYIFKAYSSDNAAINLWVTDSSGTEAQAYDDNDELFPNCTAGILICPADTYNYSGVLLVGITGKLSFMNNPFYGKVLANWKHSSIKNLFLKLTAGDDMGVWTIAL